MSETERIKKLNILNMSLSGDNTGMKVVPSLLKKPPGRAVNWNCNLRKCKSKIFRKIKM